MNAEISAKKRPCGCKNHARWSGPVFRKLISKLVRKRKGIPHTSVRLRALIICKSRREPEDLHRTEHWAQ
jgi:hypothetical protein